MDQIKADRVDGAAAESARLDNMVVFPGSKETTEMMLFVRTSGETMKGWDRAKIVEALIRETFIDRDTAEQISCEVEDVIMRGNIKVVTAPLIRELVDAKLIERGLETARKMHTRLESRYMMSNSSSCIATKKTRMCRMGRKRRI